MEQSGRNRWQSPANRARAESPKKPRKSGLSRFPVQKDLPPVERAVGVEQLVEQSDGEGIAFVVCAGNCRSLAHSFRLNPPLPANRLIARDPVVAPWNLDAAIGGRSLTTALPSQTSDVLATAAGLHPAP